MFKKLLIIGQGSIGLKHKQIAKKLFKKSQIKTLSSNPITKNVNDFNNINEALKFDPDIAVIASPAPFHVDTAISLASNGTNLIIEKPISTSFKNSQKLKKISRNKNIEILVGYNLKNSKSLNFFKNLIDQDYIGKIFSVHVEVGQHLKSWRPEKNYKQSVSANKNLGGGVLLELSHEIDYIRWIFGEIKSVSASVQKSSDLEIDVEDSAKLIFKFLSNNIYASLNMDFFRHNTSRSCEVIGKKGTLFWNGISNTVHHFDFKKQKWSKIFSSKSKEDTYLEEWKHFIECIKSENTIDPLTSVSDAYKTLRVIEAAKRSSKAKKEIKILSK